MVSNTEGYIGTDSFNHGSTGTVTVDGNGSTWTNSSNLIVGSDGNGTLVIQNGGRAFQNLCLLAKPLFCVCRTE
jgi:T5SS/PEP-CTERM-associated repeat protein